MDEKLISIIVPIYNVEKYLNGCINSVLKQTYKNIEILLIDDGSTDDSKIICDEYAKKDTRIKVVHKKNGGLSDARNVGIEKANGKYITFIDSDDDIKEDYIEYLYQLLFKNNTRMSIAAYTVISHNKMINIGLEYKEEVLSTEKCLERLLCEEGFTISSCAKLYEKSLFDNVRFPVGKLNEDNGTTYKLIMQCEKIAYGSRSVYNYYKRENSIMTSDFNERKLDLIELTEQMCNAIDNKYPNLKESTEKKRITSRFSILRQMLNTKSADKEKIKEIENYIKSRKKEILKNKKMGKRDKIALVSLLFGKNFFSFSWNIYSKIKY